MFDILDFIDSKDIREYNKDYKFTPAEQAVLIVHSCNTTIYEKIEALKELVDTFNEKEFLTDSVYASWGNKGKVEDYREVVKENIEVYETALAERDDNEDVVFFAGIVEKKYKDSPRESYFSTYEKAYDFICAEKKKYMDDEDLCKTEVYAYIKRMQLDKEYADYTQYDFDNNLRLIRVIPCEDYYEWNTDLSQQVYVHVPLPFRQGDILRVSGPFIETYYGVLPFDARTKENDIRFKIGGDGTDMILSLDIYDYKLGFDWTDDTQILQLSRCSEKEIPEDEKNLRLMSLARKGEIDWSYLLYGLKTDD